MRLMLETERACVLIRASYTTPQGCSSGMRADGWQPATFHRHPLDNRIAHAAILVPSLERGPNTKFHLIRIVKPLIMSTFLAAFLTAERFKRTLRHFMIIFYCTKRIIRIYCNSHPASRCNMSPVPCIYTVNIHSNGNSSLLPPREQPQYCEQLPSQGPACTLSHRIKG